jgi:outer membrane protein assembly factor BamA
MLSRVLRSALVAVLAMRATAAATPLRLVGVQAVGSTRISEAEIVQASGLKLGSEVSEDSVKAAARKLADTGVFAEVNYLYTPSADGATVEFRVSDGKKFVPCRFENFVWLADRWLRDELASRVPLFKGDLPYAGSLQNEVRDALSAILKERDLPGTVRISLVGDERKGIEAVQFRVEGVKIRIRRLDFPGAREIDPAILREALKPLLGIDYDRSFLNAFLARNAAPRYLERGFLRAGFAEPIVTPIPGDPGEISVAVAIAVREGRAYRVAGIRWVGGTVIGEKELAKQVHLAPGDLANSPVLLKDLAGIRELCDARGYLRSDVGFETVFDDEAGTAVYEIKVREGDLYRMGKLDIEGVEPDRVEALRKICRLKEGDPFDKTYWPSFVSQVGSRLPATPQGRTIGLKQAIDDKKRMVDVTVTIGSKAGT